MAMQGDKQARLENIQHRQLKVFTFNSLIVVVGQIGKEHGWYNTENGCTIQQQQMYEYVLSSSCYVN